MDEALSKDQQDLVSDNHNLIYSYANKMNLDINEYYDLLAIGLCKAAKTYDPDRGYAFSTYAYFVMRNECYQYWRHLNTVSQIPEELIFSYHNPFSEDSEEQDRIERLNDIFGTYQLDSTEIELREFIDSLKSIEKRIIFEKMYGYTQREIAMHIGKSQSTVSKIVIQLKEKWLNGKYRHL